MGLVDDIRELCRSILESSFPAHIFGLLIFFVGSVLIYLLGEFVPSLFFMLHVYYWPGYLVHDRWNLAIHGIVDPAEQHTSITGHVVIIVVSYAVWVMVGKLLVRFLPKDNRDAL